MNVKIKKTLYIPDWIAELLDAEGEKYEGPGTVASAAIMFFCQLKEKDKIKALKAYKEREIQRAYKPD